MIKTEISILKSESKILVQARKNNELICEILCDTVINTEFKGLYLYNNQFINKQSIYTSIAFFNYGTFDIINISADLECNHNNSWTLGI